MVFTIYRHGSHLGYMTWTIYISFHSAFLVARDSKFGPYAGRGQFQYLIVNKKLMCQHAVTFSVQKCSR